MGTTKTNRGGRPVTTRSKTTQQVAYRVSAEQRAELEAEGKRLGMGANAVAKLRAFPRKLAAVVVLAAALVSGCVADTGGFARLPEADQNTFKRCTRPIEPAIGCLGMTDIAEFMCVAGGEKTYSAQPTARARKEWLVANGCPPAMVQPAKFIADESTETEEVPPRPSGAEAAAAAGAAAGAAAKTSGSATGAAK